MKNKSIMLIAGSLLFAASLLVAAEGRPGAGPNEKTDKYQVVISNFTFTPATLTVPAGTKVTWVNRDDEPHKVVSTGKTFSPSPVLDTGDHYSVSFARPGTYDYFCSIHPRMAGKIVVQ